MAEKIYNRNPAAMPEGTYKETKYGTLDLLLKTAGSLANAVAEQNYATGMKLITEELVNTAYKNNPESVEGFNAEIEKGLAKLEQKGGILPGVMNKLRENVALNTTTKITAIESNIKKRQDEVAKIQATQIKENWNNNMGELYGIMYRAQRMEGALHLGEKENIRLDYLCNSIIQEPQIIGLKEQSKHIANSGLT